MKNKKIIFTTIFVVVVSSFTFVFSFSLNNDTKNTFTDKTKNTKSQVKVYNHTFPERVSKNDYFKGEFISNDTASIYPRRDAIVRDILVDIGDEVKIGDTLAILFEPGVEGESDTKINLKSTMLQTKSNLLKDVQNVANAKLDEIDSKISEKEIIVNETINNFDSKINQLKNLIENKTTTEDLSVTSTLSKVTVEEKKLEKLETSLENAINSREEKINNSKNNITQKLDLFSQKIDEVFFNLIPIFYIGNEINMNYSKVDEYEIIDEFGAKNTTLKKDLLLDVNNYQASVSSLEILEKYEKLISINKKLIKTLESSIISTRLSESIISSKVNSINMYSTELLMKKENYDDAINDYNILVKTEEEKIENLKKQIVEQKETINFFKSNYDLVNSGKTQSIENLELEMEKLLTDKSLQVGKLKAQLETLKKSRTLLNANENKNITSIKNEMAVAKADLNNEYIKSGDYKIISPFSGVISKRNLEIGEKISPNIEAFRIVGVETTLSRITKKEVKFYIPEKQKEIINEGSEVYFSFGENTYTGSIYRISPEIDEKNFSIVVQAKVSDDLKLPNKSTVNVSLETKEDIFKIPTTTIYNKGDRKIIYYKKDNGKLGVKDIKIISDDGEYSLVSGDFDESLKLVTTKIFVK